MVPAGYRRLPRDFRDEYQEEMMRVAEEDEGGAGAAPPARHLQGGDTLRRLA